MQLQCYQHMTRQLVGHTLHLHGDVYNGGATTLAIHCWTPSIRCARPHGLELLAGRPLRTAGLRVLYTGPKNLAFL